MREMVVLYFTTESAEWLSLKFLCMHEGGNSYLLLYSTTFPPSLMVNMVL